MHDDSDILILTVYSLFILRNTHTVKYNDVGNPYISNKKNIT